MVYLLSNIYKRGVVSVCLSFFPSVRGRNPWDGEKFPRGRENSHKIPTNRGKIPTGRGKFPQNGGKFPRDGKKSHRGGKISTGEGKFPQGRENSHGEGKF